MQLYSKQKKSDDTEDDCQSGESDTDSSEDEIMWFLLQSISIILLSLVYVSCLFSLCWLIALLSS